MKAKGFIITPDNTGLVYLSGIYKDRLAIEDQCLDLFDLLGKCETPARKLGLYEHVEEVYNRNNAELEVIDAVIRLFKLFDDGHGGVEVTGNLVYVDSIRRVVAHYEKYGTRHEKDIFRAAVSAFGVHYVKSTKVDIDVIVAPASKELSNA